MTRQEIIDDAKVALTEVISVHEARVKVLETMQRTQDALAADTRDDVILAWHYGLGVKFDPLTGDVRAVALNHATPIREMAFRVGTVRNGAGVPAVVTRRQVAIRAEIEKGKRILQQFRTDWGID